MTSCRRSFLLAAILAFAAGCGHTPAAPVDDSQVDVFFEKARADTDHEWIEESSMPWLATLPKETQLRIAERALLDPDPVVRIVGAQVFYVLGMDERGDDAVAVLTLDGVDTLGFSWGWLHSADVDLLDRRVMGIRKAVGARYDSLTPAQRKVADDMLCGKQKDCDPRTGGVP